MVAPWRFLPCPWCCVCWMDSDTFTRANSTDLGSEWTERAGDWEIFNSTLRELGNEDAWAIFEMPCPDPWHVVKVTLVDPTGGPGRCWRIIFNYTEDGLSSSGDPDAGPPWYWVDIRDLGGAGHSVKLYRSDAPGVPLLDETVNGDFEFSGEVTICATDRAIVIRLENDGEEEEDTDWIHYVVEEQIAPMASNPKAGVGNAAVEPIAFDDFSIAIHGARVKEWDPLCPWCICWCDEYVIPPELTATIVGWDCDCPPTSSSSSGEGSSEGCSKGDGWTFDLFWHPRWHFWCRDSDPGIGDEGEVGDDPDYPGNQYTFVRWECDMSPPGTNPCEDYAAGFSAFGTWDADPGPPWPGSYWSCCNHGLLTPHDCAITEVVPGMHSCDCRPFFWRSADIVNAGGSELAGDKGIECPWCTQCHDPDCACGGTHDYLECGGYYVTITE